MDILQHRLETSRIDPKTVHMCNELFSALYNGDETVFGVPFEMALFNISTCPLSRKMSFIIQESLFWVLFPQLKETESVVMIDKVFCALQLYENLRDPQRNSHLTHLSVDEKRHLIRDVEATFSEWYSIDNLF
jgi:hypothetical protein